MKAFIIAVLGFLFVFFVVMVKEWAGGLVIVPGPELGKAVSVAGGYAFVGGFLAWSYFAD